MEALHTAIDTTPIIDHHAHNLLLPQHLEAHNLLSITSEASGRALQNATSTLAHIRAVQQLSEVLGCAATWDDVQAALVERRKESDDAWAKRCFEGIQTVLIDDGLDGSVVHPYQWHDRLTVTECKRIVRIEKVAETILADLQHSSAENADQELAQKWTRAFVDEIRNCVNDPDVVGFKSVICYRTGLAISLPEELRGIAHRSVVDGVFPSDDTMLLGKGEVLYEAVKDFTESQSERLAHEILSPYFLYLTAYILSASSQAGQVKPLQFHTGLGDNDINLSKSSPAHLQPFIEEFPLVPVVLLHAGYPFTKEGGYLASVYGNAYLDIGEVFPMVSQEGQEQIIRESLELCPSEKLCWSTDGHWFPETYLLAVMQVKQAMKNVLGGCVVGRSLTSEQAIAVVRDIFFNTSNRLYNLGLGLESIQRQPFSSLLLKQSSHLEAFDAFMAKQPSVKFLRLQWLDYTTTLRLRIVPVAKAREMIEQQSYIGITKAVFGLLQNDSITPGFLPVGEYKLTPCLEGLRLAARPGYATVQCEFRHDYGLELAMCPRTALRRVVESAYRQHGLSFLIGFELEVIFLTPKMMSPDQEEPSLNYAHSWSNAASLRNNELMVMIEEIIEMVSLAEIDLLQFHPESAPGQFEFITAPLAPLNAVDTLLATRDIIYTIAEKHGLKATFTPKPFPMTAGTGAHVHISMTPEPKVPVYEAFYAGVLKNLREIMAFTYSGPASYERMADSAWSGGRYVAWGRQNREVPLRKIEGSHWEFKCMDGLANPYLALAAILTVGLKGIEDGEVLTIGECLEDPATMSYQEKEKLGIKLIGFVSGAKGFVQALDALRDVQAGGMFEGAHIGEAVDTYLAVKDAELKMLMGMTKDDRRTFMLKHY